MMSMSTEVHVDRGGKDLKLKTHHLFRTKITCTLSDTSPFLSTQVDTDKSSIG